MSLLVVLCLLLAVAVTAPFAGADTRYPGSERRADRPRAGKRYRRAWDSALNEQIHRDQFDQTS